MLSQRFVQVINSQGLHARPADLIVRCAGQFGSRLAIIKNGESFDCRSILDMMMLGASQGTQLLVTAEGDDSESALAAVAKLFDDGFYELEAPSNSGHSDLGQTHAGPSDSDRSHPGSALPYATDPPPQHSPY